MRTRVLLSSSLFLGLAAAVVGCGKTVKQPDFPGLYPVKGTVKWGSQPANGGRLQFFPETGKTEFLTNSEVASDGTYSLVTVRTTDKVGERRPGAPPGKYKVSYVPPQGNQGEKGEVPPSPVDLPTPVTVKEGENDIPLEFPKR